MMWSHHWIVIAVVLFSFAITAAVAFEAPASKCYALDKDYHLYDFTQWIGHEFEHSNGDEDLTLRFCKDVQLRSHEGYVNLGRFAPALFVSGQSSNFVQTYNEGDLKNCEHNGYDETGRNSEVSIICGSCSGSSSCSDSFGCICNASSNASGCRSTIVLAVKCVQAGARVLKGFTVGFNPRGKEVVDNGITQWGFEKFHEDYSFATEQRTVSLYFTAPAAFARNIRKPSFTVKPSKGLTVKLTGSAADGDPPTTESPTILGAEWQCEASSGGPYVITISVPADGFDPIVFHLGKECEHKQKYGKGGSTGWATFGVLSLTFIILVTGCCCVGFCYNTRVEHKYGLEALPGVSSLARYLDSASGGPRADGYRAAEEASSTERSASSARQRTDSKYGAV